MVAIAVNSVFSATHQTLPEASGFISGYIPITKEDNLFYLLIKSEKNNAPLVIFLNGGPGASSMTGAFVANGPYLLKNPFSHESNYELTKNSWSWNKVANVVYLDQPRYVGYSHGNGKYLTSLNEAGRDFLTWLKLFYQRYPEFKNRPLYLTGESFAGTYIAEFTHKILQYNKKNSNKIKLKGLFVQVGTIGDDQRYGLNSSPKYQLLFLCKQNILPASACDPTLKNNLQDILKICISHVAEDRHIPSSTVKITDIHKYAKQNKECGKYLSEITHQPKYLPYTVPNIPSLPEYIRGQTVQEPIDSLEFYETSQIRQHLKYSPGPYNMRLACKPSGGFPPWCYDNYKIIKFFNDPDIKSWIGKQLIPHDVDWEFAKFLIPISLIGPKLPIWPTESYYAEALKNNIKIVFAFGKDDWVINYISAQEIANKIAEKAFGKWIFDQLPAPLSSMHEIIIGDHQRAGEYLSFQNMTFAQINDAGHIIGMDQPEVVYKLLSSLIQK